MNGGLVCNRNSRSNCARKGLECFHYTVSNSQSNDFDRETGNSGRMYYQYNGEFEYVYQNDFF